MSRLRKRVVPFRWSTITASFVQGTASSISLATFLTNTGGLPITYALASGSLPTGVTLSTAGVLSYNGTGAVASSTAQFRASSGVHVADSSSVSVGIAASVPTNRAPVWTGTTSLGSYSNGSAQSIPLAAYASDPDADPLTFTRQGGTAPAGVTVNASTGVLTIPVGTAAGSYTVIVRASDASLYADRTFSVTVTAVSAGAFFQPNMATVSSLSQVFADVNTYDGGTAVLSTALMRGSSKTVRIAYPNDEAGVELKPSPFTATASLFARSYEYFSEAGGSYGGTAGWATNWPVGLKTGRYFTRNDFTTGAAEPNANAYCSEKLAWQTYGGDPSDLYARGYNNATFNLDLEGTYGAGVNFANGLPYLRQGYWYKFERWYVLNSAVNAADGIMRVWIDDQLVCDRTNVVWRSSSRGCPNGSAWESMWFGGNYSGAAFGGPSGTLYRYLTDFYLSTTLDR